MDTIIPIVLTAIASPIFIKLGINLKRKRDEYVEQSMEKRRTEFANKLGMSPHDCSHYVDVMSGNMSIEEAVSRCLATRSLFRNVVREEVRNGKAIIHEVAKELMNAEKENESKRRLDWPSSQDKTRCPGVYLAFIKGYIGWYEALTGCEREK